MNAKSSRSIMAAVVTATVTAAMATCPLALAQQRPATDLAHAKELFNEGVDLREKGDVAGALEKLRAAYAAASTPITGLELGRTYVAAGKLVEAREALLAVARLEVAHQETPRSTAARASAAQLAEQVQGRIPRLTVKVEGAEPGSVTVLIDGTSLPNDTLSAPHPVNPGTHEVVATSTAGAHASATVEVRESESREVTLSVAAPHAAPPTTASVWNTPGSGATEQSEPAAARSGPSPLLVYGGFGLAGVGVAVGTVTGIVAMGKASAVNDACRNSSNCPKSIDGDLSTGRTMATISTVAFAAAGAGAVVGVLALVLGHKKEAAPSAAWITPWASPGGAGIAGATTF
jgi:hypothetical protein